MARDRRQRTAAKRPSLLIGRSAVAIVGALMLAACGAGGAQRNASRASSDAALTALTQAVDRVMAVPFRFERTTTVTPAQGKPMRTTGRGTDVPSSAVDEVTIGDSGQQDHVVVSGTDFYRETPDGWRVFRAGQPWVRVRPDEYLRLLSNAAGVRAASGRVTFALPSTAAARLLGSPGVATGEASLQAGRVRQVSLKGKAHDGSAFALQLSIDPTPATPVTLPTTSSQVASFGDLFRASGIDPCQVSPSALVGQVVASPSPPNPRRVQIGRYGVCRFETGDGTKIDVSIFDIPVTTEEEFEAEIRGAPGYGAGMPPSEPVAGVGDEALWIPPFSRLFALRGSTFFSVLVVLPGRDPATTKAAAIQIASAVAQTLRP